MAAGDGVCGAAGVGAGAGRGGEPVRGGMVRVSKAGSRLEAWAVPVDEGLQIAYECGLAAEAS